MSWQSLLRPRDNMVACIYTDTFIQIAEGLPENGVFSGKLKQKWKEESKRNFNTLYAQWEKKQQADKAQKEYAAVQENIDVFPTPMMVKPMSIEAAAVSATDISWIRPSSGST